MIVVDRVRARRLEKVNDRVLDAFSFTTQAKLPLENSGKEDEAWMQLWM
jgi:hypothetical protein